MTLINKYYLYFHIINSTHQVFYVGVGTKRYGEQDYGRAFAFSSKSRNKYWHQIVNFYDKDIRVEIKEEFNNPDNCRKREQYWINKFGRNDQNQGVLCNLTDGGYSATYNVKKILQYDLEGNFIREWSSTTHAAKVLNIIPGTIYNCLRNKQSRTNKYMWKNYEKDYPLKIEPYKHTHSHKVLQLDEMGNLINTYDSMSQASKITNIDRSSIINCANGKGIRKTAGGFIWKKF